ncbi:aminotransferase class V-fold PLP-dependent enzyme [bacterium]|nr:aminotransferase class V-fold PLP-dependent enzyme [bacterium]
MLDCALLAEEFPLARDWCYLASASNGILPERSRRYLERYFGEHHYLELEPQYRMFEDLAAVRECAARLFGGAAANWALMPNTSYGLGTIAAAIDWRSGDNAVLADCEFPANVTPWQNLAARGVGLRWLATGGTRAQAERLLALCDARTRAIAVSGVQFHNGYAPDLARLAQHCRERGIWLCVDGIQGLGNRDWQLPVLGVDFLAAGGQKWLCAPRGTGLLYLSDRALAALREGRLRQATLGWLNTDTWKFTDLLDYTRPLTQTARRLEVGTYAFHDLICLGHSLALLEALGLAAVAAHSDALRERFLDGLLAQGLQAPQGPYAASCLEDPAPRRSQVLSLACPNPIALWRQLAARRIAVNPREGGVRIAFHHYTDVEDVDRLLSALAALAG